MTPQSMTLPPIVTEAEWRAERDELLAAEKQATRARDALAARRRRLPMVAVDRETYAFEGPDGRATLLDLFEGRRQLIVYTFWFPPGGPPCSGCSMLTDNLGHPAHLRARDTTYAMVSRAPQSEIVPFQERMGWEDIPWYTAVGEDFYDAFGVPGGFALNVFLRDGDRVFRTYDTTGRGVEALGPNWSLLDLTPLGRQEDWEDSPEGYPKTPRYTWWQYHDEYE